MNAVDLEGLFLSWFKDLYNNFKAIQLWTDLINYIRDQMKEVEGKLAQTTPGSPEWCRLMQELILLQKMFESARNKSLVDVQDLVNNMTSFPGTSTGGLPPTSGADLAVGTIVSELNELTK